MPEMRYGFYHSGGNAGIGIFTQAEIGFSDIFFPIFLFACLKYTLLLCMVYPVNGRSDEQLQRIFQISDQERLQSGADRRRQLRDDDRSEREKVSVP